VTRLAAALAWVAGLGFGAPGAYGAVHLARHGEVWTFLGFPTYGKGPFESAGLPTTVPLQTAFVVVCAAEVVDGYLLWRGRPSGRRLSLALLPAELAFWTGFALPFGFALGLGRVALTLRTPRSA
jgi:hypothetical protein